MIRRLVTGASKVAFNIIYKVARKRVRSREVVFLSRRTDEPSYDYRQLADEFAGRGWQVTMHLKKVTGANMIPYAFHVISEIRLLGRCAIAVLDRYDPVVSLLDFECAQSGPGVQAAGGAEGGVARSGGTGAPVNVEFPIRPTILQMWHAFGAFKKFGYQSVGTPEGHSEDFTSAFRIHRNYSWVMCSGAGVRSAFAEAFSCPEGRVVALDRPEYDEIRALSRDRRDRRDGEEPVKAAQVLMAPTLRINDDSQHPFRELYRQRECFEEAVSAEVCWSFHPLEEGLPAPGNVSDKLLQCDCVVTDYSSIVYEAYLLGVPVLFFVPDIESYRVSPGLNVDPSVTSPELCARTADDLARLIESVTADPASYPRDALERFAGSAFEVDGGRQAGSAASRIADFLIANLEFKA